MGLARCHQDARIKMFQTPPDPDRASSTVEATTYAPLAPNPFRPTPPLPNSIQSDANTTDKTYLHPANHCVSDSIQAKAAKKATPKKATPKKVCVCVLDDALEVSIIVEQQWWPGYTCLHAHTWTRLTLCIHRTR